MKHRKCIREECLHYFEGTCRPCKACGANPKEINTECAHCLRCENVPDQLRWDENEEESCQVQLVMEVRNG